MADVGQIAMHHSMGVPNLSSGRGRAACVRHVVCHVVRCVTSCVTSRGPRHAACVKSCVTPWGMLRACVTSWGALRACVTSCVMRQVASCVASALRRGGAGTLTTSCIRCVASRSLRTWCVAHGTTEGRLCEVWRRTQAYNVTLSVHFRSSKLRFFVTLCRKVIWDVGFLC